MGMAILLSCMVIYSYGKTFSIILKDYYWGDYILSEEVIALGKFNSKEN
jgi:hypothetical protein